MGSDETRRKTRDLPTSRLPLVTSVHSDGRRGCLVVIYGEALGHKYELGVTRTIGRVAANDIFLAQDSVSRHHAELCVDESGVSLRDLDSTNGTYVNDVKISQVYLRDGDLIKVGGTILKYLIGANVEANYHELLYRMFALDSLLDIPNRGSFDERLAHDALRVRRGEVPPTLLLMDIDHFRRCNEIWGRGAGDYVLRTIAQIIKESIYPTDFVARYGADEFAIISYPKNYPECIRFAERLRSFVQDHAFVFEDNRIGITVSIGVATWSGTTENTGGLVEAADACVYRAKTTGCNRVVSNVSRFLDPDELCVLFSGDLIEPRIISRFLRVLRESFAADTGSPLLIVDQHSSEWRLRSRPGLLAAWLRKVCAVWNDGSPTLGATELIHELMKEKLELLEDGYRVFMTPGSQHVILARMLTAAQPTLSVRRRKE